MMNPIGQKMAMPINVVFPLHARLGWQRPGMMSRCKRPLNNSPVCGAREFFGEKGSESCEKTKRRKGPVPVLETSSRVTVGTGVLGNPWGISFSGIQATCGVAFSSYVFATAPVNRTAGLLLIALCVSVSLSGYLRCLHRSNDLGGKGDIVDACIRAYALSKEEYSYGGGTKEGGRWTAFLLSPFYEPSFIYMLLNCWGLFAVGQSTLCRTKGGTVLLSVCALSFLLGRFLQFVFERTEKVIACEAVAPVSVSASPRREKLTEMFLLPNGTWGFGPILNALIWFCCASFPGQLYPATPTGVMAPVWTAVGIPVLLLIEDVYSLLNRSRKREKIGNGSTPGLQIASLVVGVCGGLLFR